MAQICQDLTKKRHVFTGEGSALSKKHIRVSGDQWEVDQRIRGSGEKLRISHVLF